MIFWTQQAIDVIRLEPKNLTAAQHDIFMRLARYTGMIVPYRELDNISMDWLRVNIMHIRNKLPPELEIVTVLEAGYILRQVVPKQQDKQGQLRLVSHDRLLLTE